MELQGRTGRGIKIGVALLAPILLYWKDLVIVINEALSSDISTHVLLVPILLIYLLYRIRRRILASISISRKNSSDKQILVKETFGLLLCILAYVMKWFGSYSFQPLEYHIASLPIFVTGIILLVFNFQTTKTLLFPIAFLIFLMPPPFELAQSIGSSLSVISSQTAYFLLKLLGLPVSISNEYLSPVIVLKSPSGIEVPFAIDIACSGLYSLIGFSLFSIFAVYITRGPFYKKLFILSLGLPLIYTLNILRITLIVIIGYYFETYLALKIFHLLGGWTLIFTGTLILLFIAEKITNVQLFNISDECIHSRENNIEKYCLSCGKILEIPQLNLQLYDIGKIVLILIAVFSLLFIEVPVFTMNEINAEIELTTAKQTIELLPEIVEYQLSYVYRDKFFENVSGQDASLVYLYKPHENNKSNIWVGIEIGGNKGCLHPWDVCLLTWPQSHGQETRVTQIDLRDILLVENPPIIARVFAFKKKDADITQVILYWYTKSTFKINDEYQQKWSKISVIQYTNNSTQFRVIENELKSIAQTIVNYWQPIATWSDFSRAIAENGKILITIILISLTGSIIIYVYLERMKKVEIKQLYSQISDLEDKYILDSIKSLEKGKLSISDIQETYENKSELKIDINELSKKINYAEQSGLIEKIIININDNPYYKWKTNF